MGEVSHQKGHFYVLDGMRGIGAIIVLWFHSAMLIMNLAPWGRSYLVVDFFFCLSGFVVAYSYEDRLSQDLTFRKFATARLIRLYPVLLVGAIFGGIVMGGGGNNGFFPPIAFTIAALLLLPAGLFYGLQAYPVNNPIWSLFFELFINFVFALMPRMNARVWASTACILGCAYGYVTYSFGSMLEVGFADWTSFAAGFVRVSYPFAAGICIYKFGVQNYTRIPAILPITGLLLMMAIPLDARLGGAVCSVIILPTLVAMGAMSKPLTRLNPAFRWLSDLSYPLYLIHMPVIRALRHVPLDGRFGSIGSFILALVAVAVSFVSTIIVVYCFDVPVRRIISQYQRRAKTNAQLHQYKTDRGITSL